MTTSRTIYPSRQFEPEGIFLLSPLEGACQLLQNWGAHPASHAAYTYNGVPLKGHPGLDFGAAPGTTVRAADEGRVVEINAELGGLGLAGFGLTGFGRYLKLEHRWGESLYAQLDKIVVEAGQGVERGAALGTIAPASLPYLSHLHFAVRIFPYNRFDGWGGFSDPLPFLYQLTLMPFETNDLAAEDFLPPPLLLETKGRRRP